MTSIPSLNVTPRTSFGTWLCPSRRRQLFCAPSTSLKTIASAVPFDRQPFDRMVRWRTVAKVLSMGLVVRKCFQCDRLYGSCVRCFSNLIIENEFAGSAAKRGWDSRFDRDYVVLAVVLVWIREAVSQDAPPQRGVQLWRDAEHLAERGDRQRCRNVRLGLARFHFAPSKNYLHNSPSSATSRRRRRCDG